jgi:hypothetical protein
MTQARKSCHSNKQHTAAAQPHAACRPAMILVTHRVPPLAHHRPALSIKLAKVQSLWEGIAIYWRATLLQQCKLWQNGSACDQVSRTAIAQCRRYRRSLSV